MIQRYVVEPEYKYGDAMPLSDIRLVPVETKVGKHYFCDVCKSEDVLELEARLPVPGTFAWAIIQVMNGLKIRRACWNEGSYAYSTIMNDLNFKNPSNSEAVRFLTVIGPDMLNAIDWEIAP